MCIWGKLPRFRFWGNISPRARKNQKDKMATRFVNVPCWNDDAGSFQDRSTGEYVLSVEISYTELYAAVTNLQLLDLAVAANCPDVCFVDPVLKAAYS
jgi:hypothetical protein